MDPSQRTTPNVTAQPMEISAPNFRTTQSGSSPRPPRRRLSHAERLARFDRFAAVRALGATVQAAARAAGASAPTMSREARLVRQFGIDALTPRTPPGRRAWAIESSLLAWFKCQVAQWLADGQSLESAHQRLVADPRCPRWLVFALAKIPDGRRFRKAPSWASEPLGGYTDSPQATKTAGRPRCNPVQTKSGSRAHPVVARFDRN